MHSPILIRCKELMYKQGHFDFIHVRNLAQSIRDWPRLMKEIYRCTKPGGYVELCELGMMFHSDDGTLPPTHGVLVCFLPIVLPTWKLPIWHLYLSSATENTSTRQWIKWDCQRVLMPKIWCDILKKAGSRTSMSSASNSLWDFGPKRDGSNKLVRWYAWIPSESPHAQFYRWQYLTDVVCILASWLITIYILVVAIIDSGYMDANSTRWKE